ncbi:hypothetical protein Taro_056577 [Colocasia esculenta]|uniref:Uncharacterized protein n=1 Tax=Colocasia esculenta TaxID=4460 RepID=A0A843XWU8_COLES|nr:hypothetical protein [Colocasia esculenta]
MKDEDGWVRGTGCLMVGGTGGAVEGDGGEERVGVARDEVSGALEAMALLALTLEQMALLALTLELMALLALVAEEQQLVCSEKPY